MTNEEPKKPEEETPIQKPEKRGEIGRPSVFDNPETLRKLEEAFAMGCTDTEACLYADIAPSTLYKYQVENPDFVERKQQLKENPILLARQTVINDLENPETAKWFLERKRKDEFASRQEITGEKGKNLLTGMTDEEKQRLDSILFPERVQVKVVEPEQIEAPVEAQDTEQPAG